MRTKIIILYAILGILMQQKQS